MFGEECAQQLRNIQLTDNTISQQIDDMLEDFEEQLIEKLRNKYFSIQIDKATDSSGTGLLIAYLPHVEDTTVN
jgi:hypothetical protein